MMYKKYGQVKDDLEKYDPKKVQKSIKNENQL